MKAVAEGGLVQVRAGHAYAGCVGAAGPPCQHGLQEVSLAGPAGVETVVARPDELALFTGVPPRPVSTPHEARANVKIAGLGAGLAAAAAAGDVDSAEQYVSRLAAEEEVRDA